MITLNNVMSALEQIATNHRQINSYGTGDLYDIVTSGDTSYPLMYTIMENSQIGNKAEALTFTILIMDAVKGGRVNEDDVASDTLEIVKDIVAQLQHPSYTWSFENDLITIEPFTERFTDSVTGYSFRVTLVLPFAYDRCQIPYTPTSIQTSGGSGGSGCGWVVSINGDGTSTHTLVVGTSGTDFNIADEGLGVHRFNIPTASATNRGALSSTDWSTFNNKGSGTVTSVSGTANRITSTGGATPVLDISSVFEALLGKVANPLSQFAATTSAELAGVISDETGYTTGALAVFNTSPTFVTDITTPLIIGGTAVGSGITYKSTTGVGTTSGIAHLFKGGNNGATSILTILNDGKVGIGATPSTANVSLEVTNTIGSVNPVQINVNGNGGIRMSRTAASPGSVVWNVTSNGGSGISSDNNFGLSQGGVNTFTAVSTGAVANTLYLKNGNTLLGSTTDNGYKLEVTGTARISGSTVIGTAALATTATTGFLYLPTCAGLPTGVPATQTGTAAVVIDTTNNKMYIYSGGAWVALN